jgi:hypothetical protein
LKRRSSLRFAVVVWAEAPGKEAEPVLERVQAAKRIGRRRFEPAVRPGGQPGQDDAGLPGLTQRAIHAVDAPDREHVCRVAATDVDRVLVQEKRLEVGDLAVEERKVRRFGPAGKRRVEVGHIGLGIAARRGQETNARAVMASTGASQGEHVVIEQIVVGFHRETPTAHRQDRPFRAAHRSLTPQLPRSSAH